MKCFNLIMVDNPIGTDNSLIREFIKDDEKDYLLKDRNMERIKDRLKCPCCNTFLILKVDGEYHGL